MIQRIALCLAVSCCFAPGLLKAQVNRRDTMDAKKQVEIIHFSGDEETKPVKGKHAKKKKQPLLANSVVKTAPLSFIMGYLPLYYERELSDWLGLQVGAGITFKPVAYKPIRTFYGELYDSMPCPTGDCNYNLDYTYRKSKVSFMFTLSPRFYLSKEGIDGTYLAPEIRFYNRQSQAQKVNPFDAQLRDAGKFDSEKINITDLMLYFGHQSITNRFAVDWSMGAGLRLISGNWQQVYLDEFGLYQSNTPNQHYARFHVDLGLRFGFK